MIDEYFRLATASVSDVIAVADADGTISYVTPSIESALGFTPAERIGRRLGESVHPDDRPAFETAMHAMISEGSFPRSEYRFRHKDGTWRTIEIHGRNLLGDPTVAALVFNSRDVTAEKRMQKELGQLNRLTCLGRLSAHTAHEFNNMLMGMQTLLEVLQRRTKDDEQLTRIAGSMKAALNRGRCMTRDMLRFTAPAQSSQERIDVTRCLRRLAEEIQPLMGRGIELSLQLGDKPLYIRGDSTQLQQVFINLALNARDAMQERGGTLTIGVREGSKHTAAAIVDMPNADRFVHFNVTDTGEGVAREDLAYIFEPLFTTKKSGTGLGLSVVHQIITAAGGKILVESEKGRGTTIHIFLPAADVPEIRVLMAEDDNAIAEGIAWALQEQGMETRTVGRADEVIPAVASFKPDVVLLDLSLADGDALEAGEQIARRHSIPVIYSTGSSYNGPKDVPVLMKPYGIDELLQAINDVLHRNRSH